jgi:transcriptional regulator with XRE-family HTH domain
MTRFFRTYKELCEKVGKSPNAVAKELGISSGSVTAWKQGRTPKYETIEKIATFFSTDIEDFFLSNQPRTDEEIEENNIFWDGYQLAKDLAQQEKPAPTNGDGLSEDDKRIIELLHQLTPENRERIVEIIKALASQ